MSLDNVRELLAEVERQLIDRRNELSVVEQKIQQRDRLIAEVSALEERKQQILAEQSMLDDARREISEVKDEAAKASGELASVNQELDAKCEELAKLEESLDPARLEDLKRKFLSLEQDVQRLEQEKSALERAIHDLDTKRAEHQELQARLPVLREQIVNAESEKYRATDLARLLIHMDPKGENGKDRTDHMSLVLLDEMNLARVEYYFSEFLSRLEVRPRYENRLDDSKRRDALIPIDIRGLKKTISLFPSHNVLFAGTMNDDESTQALSDKVLDRGNIMQFAAPRDFAKKIGKAVERPGEAQSFASWRTWVKSPDTLPRACQEDAKDVLAQLATIMESCGRPFGHRLRDSILAYVASYPFSGNGSPDVKIPLADQIEFRILPKLRGIEIDSHGEAFDRLEKLWRDKLADSVFANRLADLQERQKKGTGLFTWRGLSREG